MNEETVEKPPPPTTPNPKHVFKAGSLTELEETSMKSQDKILSQTIINRRASAPEVEDSGFSPKRTSGVHFKIMSSIARAKRRSVTRYDVLNKRMNSGNDVAILPVHPAGFDRLVLNEEFVAELCTYVPLPIMQNVLESITDPITKNINQDHTQNSNLRFRLPRIQRVFVAAMFLDVSGFTQMCENLNEKYGRTSSEMLAFYLNRYFELLIKHTGKGAGEVMKFVGDALIVFFQSDDEKGLVLAIRRAIQCAMSMQEEADKASLSGDVQLSVKCGIGAGECCILHVGNGKRVEYVATGSPLHQAFACESQAIGGQVIISPEVLQFVNDFVEGESLSSGGFLVRSFKSKIKNVSAASVRRGVISALQVDRECSENLLRYVPDASFSYMNNESHRWAGRLVPLTVIFLNLGFNHREMINMDINAVATKIQSSLEVVLEALEKHGGSLNKFMIDDKGATLVAIFGVESHKNDAEHALLAALDIYNGLSSETFLGQLPENSKTDRNLKLKCSIGVTTGVCFVGLIGNAIRREFAVLGDVVNLSARLMASAKEFPIRLLCDKTTCDCTLPATEGGEVEFLAMEPIFVKGKKSAIPIFLPIRRTSGYSSAILGDSVLGSSSHSIHFAAQPPAFHTLPFQYGDHRALDLLSASLHSMTRSASQENTLVNAKARRSSISLTDSDLSKSQDNSFDRFKQLAMQRNKDDPIFQHPLNILMHQKRRNPSFSPPTSERGNSQPLQAATQSGATIKKNTPRHSISFNISDSIQSIASAAGEKALLLSKSMKYDRGRDASGLMSPPRTESMDDIEETDQDLAQLEEAKEAAAKWVELGALAGGVVGREKTLLKLQEEILDFSRTSDGRSMIITGMHGTGKTTVIKCLRYPQATSRVVFGRTLNRHSHQPFEVWMPVFNALFDTGYTLEHSVPYEESTIHDHNPSEDERTKKLRTRHLSGTWSGEWKSEVEESRTGMVARSSQESMVSLSHIDGSLAPEFARLRQNIVQSVLEKPTDKDLQQVAPLLNEILGLRIPATSDSDTLASHKDCNKVIVRALAGLLRNVASNFPLIIVFDNAHYMDHWSIELLTRVRRWAVRNIMFIISTPKIGPDWRLCSSEFSAFLDCPNTCLLHLRGLNEANTTHLMTRLLAVHELHASLSRLTWAVTRGIPGLIIAFASTLLRSDLLTRSLSWIGRLRTNDNEKGQNNKITVVCGLDESFDMVQDLELPCLVERLVATHLKFLSPRQRIIMNSICIGAMWRFDEGISIKTLLAILPLKMDIEEIYETLEVLKKHQLIIVTGLEASSETPTRKDFTAEKKSVHEARKKQDHSLQEKKENVSESSIYTKDTKSRSAKFMVSLEKSMKRSRRYVYDGEESTNVPHTEQGDTTKTIQVQSKEDSEIVGDLQESQDNADIESEALEAITSKISTQNARDNAERHFYRLVHKTLELVLYNQMMQAQRQHLHKAMATYLENHIVPTGRHDIDPEEAILNAHRSLGEMSHNISAIHSSNSIGDFMNEHVTSGSLNSSRGSVISPEPNETMRPRRSSVLMQSLKQKSKKDLNDSIEEEKSGNRRTSIGRRKKSAMMTVLAMQERVTHKGLAPLQEIVEESDSQFQIEAQNGQVARNVKRGSIIDTLRGILPHANRIEEEESPSNTYRSGDNGFWGSIVYVTHRDHIMTPETNSVHASFQKRAPNSPRHCYCGIQ